MSKSRSGRSFSAAPKARAGSDQRTGGSGAGSPREKMVQSSVSLRPSQWKRLDVLGDLTQWGRSGALAQAVELLTALPVSLAQRLVTLSRTTARDALRDRLREAVEQAVAAAEAELPDDPWAEFDTALAAVGEDFRRSGASERSEAELIAAADRAKRGSRRERAARRSSAR